MRRAVHHRDTQLQNAADRYKLPDNVLRANVAPTSDYSPRQYGPPERQERHLERLTLVTLPTFTPPDTTFDVWLILAPQNDSSTIVLYQAAPRPTP